MYKEQSHEFHRVILQTKAAVSSSPCPSASPLPQLPHSISYNRLSSFDGSTIFFSLASRGVSSATSFLLEPGTSLLCPFLFSWCLLLPSPSTRASRISTCGVARNRSGDHGSSLSSDSGLRQPEHGRSVTLLMSLELSFHRPFRLASTSETHNVGEFLTLV